MSGITVSTCSLNQWALDFAGNKSRTLESIRIAKEQGSCYRLGPELEITGYGCNDHFLEVDTYLHSWEILAELLKSPECEDIICDVGMPVMFKNVKYNCRVIFLNHRILLIRPKMWLANDGNYREMRWFTPWSKPRCVEEFSLPEIIQSIAGQTVVAFGDGVISTKDTTFGTELCEELFTPNSPHILMGLDGVEIFTNGSGSHHEFSKLHQRVDLILSATAKSGGVYLYSNQQGCDGERTYYDGCALIIVNGKVIQQGSQFSLRDVEVITATVNLESVRSFRGSISRGLQAARTEPYPRINIDFKASNGRHGAGFLLFESKEVGVQYHTPADEIRLGPACWLWDYLRRSKSNGFFLPLSGGIDSCATALIVFSMCDLVYKAVADGDTKILSDLRQVAGDVEFIPKRPQDICNKIFHTSFMGSENSSAETRSRARRLSSEINSYHIDLNIDTITNSILQVFEVATGRRPVFKIFGGSHTENLALQNVQARSRMILSYLFAQLILWVRGRSGGLLVLGSANVDETLRGYFTKYDCSSADINPIGGISKADLRKFIESSKSKFELPILQEFLEATPTAELEPITKDYVQSDEVDMGMTYDDLTVFGTLRKVSQCGPVQMFCRLIDVWGSMINPIEIAAKVKKFFYYYSINRHKTTILPPSYHMSPYSPDDNRFDHRPILYNAGWNWQFEKIDSLANSLNKED